MKKFFAFAIAAATMAVGCQKIQDLVNPNHKQTVGEDELVEIKFSSNVVTAEVHGTKSIDDLKEAVSVQVYGLNDADVTVTGDKRRELIDVTATVGVEREAAEPYTLSLADAAFYHASAKYSFYGYFLNGATITGDPKTKYAEALPLKITGKEDVLLAKGDDNGNYSAVKARDNKDVSLTFKHALSKFTFKAANLGKSKMTLGNVVVTAPLEGTVTLTGEGQGCVAGTTTGTINLDTQDLEMESQAGVVEGSLNYVPVNNTAGEAVVEALVFPAAQDAKTITLSFELSQTTTGGATETRWISYDVENAILANTHYTFEVKFYSLTEIKIKATLAPWGTETIEVNTDNLEDVDSPLA